MIWLFILIGILLPQLGLSAKVQQIVAIVLLIVALVLFVVWPDLDVRVRTDP